MNLPAAYLSLQDRSRVLYENTTIIINRAAYYVTGCAHLRSYIRYGMHSMPSSPRRAKFVVRLVHFIFRHGRDGGKIVIEYKTQNTAESAPTKSNAMLFTFLNV